MLQPLGAAIGSLFGFGILVLATRRGQFLSIASFGAGAGVATIASVVTGGGTTLAYTTGSIPRQAAVRSVRKTIVLPMVALATVVAVTTYALLGGLAPMAVAAGGLSTAAGIGAELDASFLRRRLWTGRLFIIETTNRLLAFGFILSGLDFAFAMVGGAAIRAALLRLSSGGDPSRVGHLAMTRATLRLAYEVRLTSLSVLYAISDRIASLSAPWVAPIPVAGGFVAVINAQQSLTGVLMTGIQTTLAVRSERRARIAWAGWVDLLMVCGGLILALGMLLWRDPILAFLGMEHGSQSALYWAPVALLIPAALTSRVLEFRLIATALPSAAVSARFIATLIIVSLALLAHIKADISLLGLGLLAGELASVAASLILSAILQPRLASGMSNA